MMVTRFVTLTLTFSSVSWYGAPDLNANDETGLVLFALDVYLSFRGKSVEIQAVYVIILTKPRNQKV